MRDKFTIAAAGLALMLVFSGSAARAERAEFVRAAETLIQAGTDALAADESFEALKLFEQAIVADPMNASGYVGLGRVHVNLDRIKSGLNYFTVALEIEPTHLGALEAEAMTLLTLGEAEDAEATLARIKRVCGDRDCQEMAHVAAAIADFRADKKVAENSE